MPDWLLILLGLVVLVVAAEYLIRGAVGIALALGVSKLMVGLTIVAFGTSAPELVVGIVDVLRSDELLRSTGATRGAIAIGTVLGSNIANIGLILGLTALLRPMPIVGSTLRQEIGFLLLLTGMTFVPLACEGVANRGLGAAMLAVLIFFTLLLVYRERRAHRTRVKPAAAAEAAAANYHVGASLLFTLLGLVGLRFGAGWLVDGCTNVAKGWGVSEAMISATIVAVGSSLPELVTSVMSARRGHPELVLGNILGSNMFNIGTVLGSAAILHPFDFSFEQHGIRLGAATAMTLAIAFVVLRRRHIGRPGGAVLLAGYLAFLAYEVVDALRA